MANYDYVLKIGADTDSIMEEILKTYSNVQKKVNGDEIELKFSCDDEEILKLINRVQELDPEIGTSIKLNLDQTALKNQLDQLNKIINQNMNSTSIMKELKINADVDTKAIDSLDFKEYLKKWTDYSKNITKNVAKDYINTLYSDIGKIDFSKEDVSYGRIVESISKYQELIAYAKKTSELYPTLNFPDFSSELENLYKNSANYIAQNKDILKNSLIDSYKDEINDFKDIVKKMGVQTDTFPIVEVDVLPSVDPVEFAKNVQNKIKEQHVEIEVEAKIKEHETEIGQSGEENDDNNGNVNVGVTPNFSPQEFISEINSKLKGLSVNVDVNAMLNGTFSKNGSNFADVFRQWKNADEIMNVGNREDMKSRLRERVLFMNYDSGYATNSYVADKFDTVTGKIAYRLLETAEQEVDSVVHSHPQENLAAFSTKDLKFAKSIQQRTDGTMNKTFVKANDQVAMFDLNKIDASTLDKVINKYNEIEQKLHSLSGKEAIDYYKQLYPDYSTIDATQKHLQDSLWEILGDYKDAFTVFSIDDFIDLNSAKGAQSTSYEIPIKPDVSGFISDIQTSIEGEIEVPIVPNTETFMESIQSSIEGNIEIPIVPDAITFMDDIRTFVDGNVEIPISPIENQSQNADNGIKQHDESDKPLNGDNQTPKLNDIGDEISKLTELDKKVGEVIVSIDNKTQAFNCEGETVTEVTQSELTDLEILEDQITEIIKYVNSLTEIIQALPELPTLSQIDSDVLPENFVEELSKISQTLSGFDVENFVSVVNAINDLKVTPKAGENLQAFANAFLTFKSNLNNFSESSKETLSSINQLLSKSEELKNLATVLSATKEQIEKVRHGNNFAPEISIDDIVSRSYEDAENAIRGVYIEQSNLNTLLAQQESGKYVENELAEQFEKTSKAIEQARIQLDLLNDALAHGYISEKSFAELSHDLEDALIGSPESLDSMVNTSLNRKSGSSTRRKGYDLKDVDFTNAENAYKTLTENAERYYSLLNKKIQGKSLSVSESVDFEILDKQYRAAADGVGVYGEQLSDAEQKAKDLYEVQLRIVRDSFKKDYVDTLDNTYEQLKNDKDSKPESYAKELATLKQQIDELKSHLPITGYTSNDEVNKIAELHANISKLVNDLNSSGYGYAKDTSVSNLQKRVSAWVNSNGAAYKSYKSEIDAIFNRLSSGSKMTQEELSGITAEFNRIVTAAQNAGKTGQTFGEKVTGKFKELGSYLLSFASFYEIIDIGRQAVAIVTELDDAFTEMRKVTNEPLHVLKEYQASTFSIAGEVGTTSSQIQNSTADWMRLGETLEDAKKSARESTILLNVSEFDSIDAATESLVAMSQAYQELSKMEIIDKLNNIGNNYSISTDDLATALQKSAAVLKTQGNDIDEAIALITAGNAIGQDSNSTAGGIRTISLRIAGTEEAKKELAELGEDVEDYVVQTKSKTDEIIRHYTAVASNNGKGVSVLDYNGNLRNTFDILLDISKIYKEIQEEDKKYGTNRANALVEELAGKNRSNIAASILQNGDLLESVYETSKQSDGSAQQELDKYLDSITGKITELTNQLQELAYISLDSDALKIVVEILTQAVSFATSLVDEFGLLNIAISTVVGAIATKKGFGKNRSL